MPDLSKECPVVSVTNSLLNKQKSLDPICWTSSHSQSINLTNIFTMMTYQLFPWTKYPKFWNQTWFLQIADMPFNLHSFIHWSDIWVKAIYSGYQQNCVVTLKSYIYIYGITLQIHYNTVVHNIIWLFGPLPILSMCKILIITLFCYHNFPRDRQLPYGD